MSARRIYTPDGHPAWKIEEPARAYRHVQTYGTHGIYGEFVTGGPGPVELGRRQTQAHKKREAGK